MPPSPAGRLPWAGLLALTALGLAARLALFTGLALGDDVFYGTQSYATGVAGWWPPGPRHWYNRLGMIGPTALALRLVGPQPWAFVLWPLLVGTLAVPVYSLVARREFGPRAGWLAGLFAALYPLDLIYATHLFPDVPVGAFSALSVYAWLTALRTDARGWYALAGGLFAAGYLCRETVLLDGPVYLALWAWAGRIWRPRLLWVAVVPTLVFGLETALFATTAGDPLYRWKAVLAQQGDADNLALIAGSQRGGGFWTDPLLLLVMSHEFALYLAAAVLAGWRRWPEVRPFVVWLVVGFLWTYYGTTVPTRWVPMQRDPRYAAALALPAILILSRSLAVLPIRWRWGLAGVLVAAGLVGASLDQGNTVLRPHAAFLRSEYAAADATLEPFEYYGARWANGLASPVPFACATDQGRGTTAERVQALPATVVRPATEGRYAVVSPVRRKDLLDGLTAKGWRVAAEFPGRPTPAREWAARALGLLPGQEQRAKRILTPPGLVVLERPAVP